MQHVKNWIFREISECGNCSLTNKCSLSINLSNYFVNNSNFQVPKFLHMQGAKNAIVFAILFSFLPLGPSRLGNCMPRGRSRRKASTAAWCRKGGSEVCGPPGTSSSPSPAVRARTTCSSSHRPSSASIATHWSECYTRYRLEIQCTARRSR